MDATNLKNTASIKQDEYLTDSKSTEKYETSEYLIYLNF